MVCFFHHRQQHDLKVQLSYGQQLIVIFCDSDQTSSSAVALNYFHIMDKSVSSNGTLYFLFLQTSLLTNSISLSFGQFEPYTSLNLLLPFMFFQSFCFCIYFLSPSLDVFKMSWKAKDCYDESFKVSSTCSHQGITAVYKFK